MYFGGLLPVFDAPRRAGAFAPVHPLHSRRGAASDRLSATLIKIAILEESWWLQP